MYGFNETILIVEDQKEILESILSAFEEDTDKECLLARDADAGLEVLLERPVQLIITDLKIAAMDGAEFCEKVRQMGLSIPIIAVSEGSQNERMHRLLRSGVSTFLVKPLHKEELVETVNYHLGIELLHQLQTVIMENILQTEYQTLPLRDKIQILKSKFDFG